MTSSVLANDPGRYFSPVEIPQAPSSIACPTIACIRASSFAVGARSSNAITARRTELCPTSRHTFSPTPIRSSPSKYGANGHGALPSGPPITVVIP